MRKQPTERWEYVSVDGEVFPFPKKRKERGKNLKRRSGRDFFLLDGGVPGDASPSPATATGPLAKAVRRHVTQTAGSRATQSPPIT